MLIGYPADKALEKSESVFGRIDVDGSGEIDYSEWILATINKEKLLTEERIAQIFQLFDRDGGGTIDGAEIKQIISAGDDVDDGVWDEIINEVDEDGSGEIDQEEFAQMLRNIIIVPAQN